MPKHRSVVHKVLAAAAGCLALSALASASTWVVDINGTGNFTQLTAAVAAAQPGDVIIVLPGTYDPPQASTAITKGVTLVGLGPVDLLTPSSSEVHIDGVPAGETLVLVGIRTGIVHLRNSPGSITIRESTIGWGGASLASIDVDACADVRIQAMSGNVGAVLARN